MNIITEIEKLKQNGWKIELNSTQLEQLKNLKINKNTFNVFKAYDEITQMLEAEVKVKKSSELQSSVGF